MNWLINTRLLSNPVNWLTIGAMLLLVAFGALAIYSRFHSTKVSAPSSDGPAVEYAKES